MYDVPQELYFTYQNSLDACVEILSVCNYPALERVFDWYRPQIVIHVAAHKHVLLMEHNCCETIENNVFGTLNAVEFAEKYRVQHFMMVSTDNYSPYIAHHGNRFFLFCDIISKAGDKKSSLKREERIKLALFSFIEEIILFFVLYSAILGNDCESVIKKLLDFCMWRKLKIIFVYSVHLHIKNFAHS